MIKGIGALDVELEFLFLFDEIFCYNLLTYYIICYILNKNKINCYKTVIIRGGIFDVKVS